MSLSGFGSINSIVFRNGLSLDGHQAIILTNVGLLLIGHLEQIWVKIEIMQQFPYKKNQCKCGLHGDNHFIVLNVLNVLLRPWLFQLCINDSPLLPYC